MVNALVTGLGRRLDSERKLADLTWRLLCAFALAIPVSIALSQTLLALTTVSAVLHKRRGAHRFPRTPLDLPILAFVLSALLAAFVGLDVSQGLWGARTYLQVVIIYLVAVYVDGPGRACTLLAFFLGGMVFTSAHTMLEAVVHAATGSGIWSPFPGSMTESGQLLFAIGFSASLLLQRQLWPRGLPWTLALHVVALVWNLKRGVWLGVLAMTAVIGSLRSRRSMAVAFAVVTLAVATVPPVRARIENTVRDFYLPGNRYDIWMAAIDVIGRFPLGIGRKNGTILRDYPNIPPHHKHAHNNALQITMEFGFLGLAAFAWWMVVFFWIAWSAWRRSPPDGPERGIALGVLATFAGFHVAGLVEYNFGDTEILEIVFLTMGLGLVVARATGAPHLPAPWTDARGTADERG